MSQNKSGINDYTEYTTNIITQPTSNNNIPNYTAEELLEMFKLDKNVSPSDIETYFDYFINYPNTESSVLIFLKQSKQQLKQYALERTSTSNNKINGSSNSIVQPPTDLSIPPILSEPLIGPPKLPVQVTTDYALTRGVQNPLNRRMVTNTICIDSILRDNYDNTSSTDFVCSLPKTMDKVVSMKLSTIDIPSSINAELTTITLTSKTNLFTIIYTKACYTDENSVVQPEVVVKFIVAIPITTSTTNNSSVVTAINDAIGLSTNAFIQNVVFTYNEYGDDKYLFKATGTVAGDSSLITMAVSFVTNTSNISQTFGWMMGFRKQTYNNIPKVSGDYVPAEYTPSSNESIDYVFLEIDDFNSNFTSDTIVSLKPKSYISNNILARVPVEHSLTYSIETSIFKPREYFGPVTIRKLGIRLIDKYGDPINLNFKNFAMSLDFAIIYN